MGGGRAKGVLFGLLWWSSIWVHQAPENPNATSRLDLLHAVVSRGTLRIDAYHQNTTNKASYRGHYYSDKPPGLALMALPTFLLLRLLLGAALESDLGWLISSWIASAATTGLLFALGGVACFTWLQRWAPPRAALLVTFGLTLGTPLLPYSTSWFPHAATASLLWVGLGLVASRRRPHPRDGSLARATGAGLCCGLACAAEYSAAIPALAVLLVACRQHSRAGAAFALGWLPAVAIVAAYHWLCFGTPLTIPYRHAAELVHMQQGLCGIHFPPPIENLSHLLLSPRQGLLFWAPALLLLLPGWRALYQRDRAWFYLTYAVPLLQWVLISGYSDVAAGFTLGPRLLLCVLPWLTVPAALAITRYPRLGGVLIFWGCLINWAALWHGLDLPPDGLVSVRETLKQPSVHHLTEGLGGPMQLSALLHLLGLATAGAWLCITTKVRDTPQCRTTPSIN